MAFQLMIGDSVIKRGVSVIDRYLPAYDTLNDPDFYIEWDDLLHYRSALEFVRDQMNADQLAELAKVDAHWQADAAAFNHAFASKHRQPKPTMRGWVSNGGDTAPVIPSSHWWWRPLS